MIRHPHWSGTPRASIAAARADGLRSAVSRAAITLSRGVTVPASRIARHGASAAVRRPIEIQIGEPEGFAVDVRDPQLQPIAEGAPGTVRRRSIFAAGRGTSAVWAVRSSTIPTGQSGGESGIRTRVTLSRKHTFQACAFNHSATSPSQRSGRPEDAQPVRRRRALRLGWRDLSPEGRRLQPRNRRCGAILSRGRKFARGLRPGGASRWVRISSLRSRWDDSLDGPIAPTEWCSGREGGGTTEGWRGRRATSLRRPPNKSVAALHRARRRSI